MIHTSYRALVLSLLCSLRDCPKLACRPPGLDSTNLHPLQNSRVFLMVSCTELSNSCLEHKSPDSSHSYPLQNSLVLLMISFTELFKSWPASLQVQILLIHTAYRTPVLSSWFPSHTCPKLARSPPGPDSMNPNPLQKCRVFC